MPTREEMRGLAEEIAGAYADRIATIAELRETVRLDLRELRTHLEELRDSRIATGRKISSDLARDATNRKKEVGSMLKELNSTRTAMSKELKADLTRSLINRKHEVGVMLNSFRNSLATTAKEMRADLSKEAADRKRETSNMKGDVGSLLRGFSTALKDIRSELAGGREEWQKLTATMQAKRGGITVEVKMPVQEIAEEAAATIPEAIALGNRVFEYLADHPDGTKITELEQEFGLARIQMARLLKKLMDENKVVKRELLYFAV